MKKGSVIAGAAMILAGAGCIAFPLTSLVVVGKIFGALLLVCGAGGLASCVKNKESIWRGLLSLAVLLGGAVIFLDAFQAVAAVDVLVKVFAAFSLFGGITQVMLAVNAKDAIKNWWVLLLSGLLTVILAVLVLANPFTGLLVADWMIAFELMMTGMLLISFGFVKPEIKVTVAEEEMAEEM